MKEDDEWKDFLHSLKFFAMMFATGLIDSIFLTLWVIAQWFIGTYIIPNFLLLDIIDNGVLRVFQVIFAISTLTPIGLHTYGDIRIMFIRTNQRVQTAEELPKKKRSYSKGQKKIQQGRDGKGTDNLVV